MKIVNAFMWLFNILFFGSQELPSHDVILQIGRNGSVLFELYQEVNIGLYCARGLIIASVFYVLAITVSLIVHLAQMKR